MSLHRPQKGQTPGHVLRGRVQPETGRPGAAGRYPRSMRGLVGLAVTAVALAACATDSAGTSRQASLTSLTVTYWSDGARISNRQQWTLRCAPPRGTLPRPGVACRKLATGGTRLFAPTPK